jgi:NIMA (never in mitosis gene a)-related kinase
MEYCEKGDLSSLLYKLKKNNKFLKENQIWSFFIQICIGLSYIHYKKILHRDLKTQNIFLTKNLNIKIGDLGIAKILQENNHANTLIGTPFYLSPEICEEKPYNEKSDVWALGCILYELITFKHPYNASNQAALLLKIINENYENFSNNIKISDNLKNIVDLLLEKNYIKRPSMIELINNKIIIEKSKELGFYQNLINIHTLYYIKEDKIIKKKQIKKINNLRENRKLSSYFLNISNRNNYLRNKHLNSIENIC